MSTVPDVERRRLPSAPALWLLATLFLLPLYPKVGLFAVSGTYIPVRADDVLIGILGLLWAASLILARRKPALPGALAGAAAIWVAVTFVALVVGAFALGSIGLFTGLAFWAKPLEYLLLGWVCYDLVQSRILSMRAILAVILGSAAIVTGYAVAEHFALVPRLAGQVSPPGVPISTIGDLHELASYLGIIGLVLAALWHRAASSPLRLAVLVGLSLVVATVFYTGARSEFVALGLCMLGLLLWRPARLPAFVAGSVMAVLFVLPFVFPAVGPDGKPIVVPEGSFGNVTDRFTGSTLPYSYNERFNIKWPALIEKTMRSPIIGLGPSAATEAADGYYMRSFVESGVVGLISFVILVGAIFVSTWRVARSAVGLTRALAVGMVASTVFVALVSVLIDTWIASRVMELYWPLLGTTLGAAALQTAMAEQPAEVVGNAPIGSPSTA